MLSGSLYGIMDNMSGSGGLPPWIKWVGNINTAVFGISAKLQLCLFFRFISGRLCCQAAWKIK